MPRLYRPLPIILSILAMNSVALAKPAIAWQPLPTIDDPIGFAGSFAGVSHDTLLVAGGANFPDRPPWEGGTKVWHDRVFALAPGSSRWTEAGRLPCPNGYGVSLTVPEGVVFIGGGDAKRNFSEVWLGRHDGRRITFTAWPRLPAPLAMAAGALVGRTIYVAGGIDKPDATQTQQTVHALDLDQLEKGWHPVAGWPGAGRILAVAGALNGAFYVVGGADLSPDAQGKPQRTWLRDAWCFTPGKGWEQLPDLPHPVVAAPSPAPTVGGALLVLGGDDGAQAGTPPGDHRGFRRDVLAYLPETHRWSIAGRLPFSLVTTATTEWRQQIIVPGGEARPGIRSVEVWAGLPQ